MKRLWILLSFVFFMSGCDQIFCDEGMTYNFETSTCEEKKEEPEDQNDDLENLVLEGNVVVLDSSFTSEIGFRETETVQFVILEDGYYTIFTDAIFNSKGTLYNAEGEQIAYDEDSYDDVNFGIEIYLERGVYSILIEPTGSAGQGRYHLYLQTGETIPEYLDYPKVYPNQSIYGTLVPGAIDYYLVEIHYASWFTIYGLSDFDNVGVIYDEEINFLQSDDNSLGDNDFGFEIYLEPGVYYFGIAGYDDVQEGNYELMITGGQQLDMLYQHPVLTTGGTGSGWLYQGESFIYELEITKSNWYTIYSYSNYDISGSVYNLWGLVDVFDDDTGGNLEFAIEVFLEPGIYTIEVYGPKVLELGWYYVMVDEGMLITESYLDDIQVGHTFNEYLNQGDSIWYKFTIETRKMIDIYVESGFDTYGYITDEFGNVLYSDDDSNGNRDFRFNMYLEPGVYYVVVTGYDETLDYGSFTIKYR